LGKTQVLGWNKESTMSNLSDGLANFGEVACGQDAKTGDYSLSFHSAIAELTAENQRLLIMIDDLLNKIECLRCVPDLQAFGSA
jgi:hypothetical protein